MNFLFCNKVKKAQLIPRRLIHSLLQSIVSHGIELSTWQQILLEILKEDLILTPGII